jgi:hypothetical protein
MFTNYLTIQKEEDDGMKLCCETNDGMYWALKGHRVESSQFGIVGVQVAGCKLHLNVLIRNSLIIVEFM